MFALGRLLLFFLAGSLGTINLYALERIFDNYYVTEEGFVKMESVPTFFFFVEFVVYFMRTLFNFLVLLRLIQVPTKAPTKEQQDIDDGIIWSTAFAVLMVTLGTNTDHNIGFETYLGSNSDTPHHHGFNLSSQAAHTGARIVSALAKMVCLVWGIIQVIVNTAKPGTFKFDRRISWHRWMVGLLDCSVFLVGVAYVLHNMYVMHPSSLNMKDVDVEGFLAAWNTEFYLFQGTELTLGFIGAAITFYSYFMYEAKASDKTVIAFSHGYRVFILGLYTSASATWHAHSMEIYQNGKADSVTLFAATPFVYFLVVSAITTMYKFVTAPVVRNLKDAANLFALTGVRVFHLSGSVLFWRLGNALCIFAMIHMLLLGFSEWVHVEIYPGTVVSNIKSVVETVENDIVFAGEKAFDVLKELDPCRWSVHENTQSTQLNEDISYSYSFPGGDSSTSKTKSFNIKNVNPAEKINCKCKDGGTDTCDCDTLNAAKRNLTWTRSLKAQFVASNDIGQIDGITKLEEFTEDKTYAQKLQKCHSIECDVVLGAAIAAETALLGSDFLWIFGPAESVVADAAWFAQQANRIGHNVIKYGMKLAKTVTGLIKRVYQMKPMIDTFKFLAGLDTVVHFSPDIGQILIALPVVLLGLFSISASLSKRENINTVVTELALVTKTYIPLTLVCWSMAGLVFAIPPLIERIIKAIPKAIIQSKIKETHSLTLMRYVFVISAIGSTFIMLSSLLASFGKLRSNGNKFLKLLREPANKLLGRDVSSDRRDEVDGGADGSEVRSFIGRIRAAFALTDPAWLQASMISFVAVGLLIYAIVNDYYLLAFHYGPTDRFISTLGSLRAHATVHGHSSEVAEVSREGLCGLIGKGVEAAIKEAVKEMGKLFGELEGSLETFFGSIEEFLGLSNLFDQFGKIAMSIFDNAWLIIEFVIAFAIPVLNAGIMLYVSFAKAYYEKKRRYEDAEYLATFCTGVIETLIYYNIILLVMVHQAYNMLGNVDFKLFYIGMETGPLFPSAAACLLLNALSVMSLYVESIYPTKK
jgi:hypothetical protein